MGNATNARDRRGALTGQLIAGHELVRVLAAGGMGEVYLARHQTLGVMRALKVIRDDRHQHEDTRERFLREAQVLARLQHNAIVQIIDFGALPSGWPFLAMEYIDGPNLDQRVEGGGPLPLHQALIVLEQIAAALHYAHKLGVIHRDLKPANVLLRGGDPRQVKLIDFGLARTRQPSGEMRLTAEGQMVGSPLYMSPEQADGRLDVTAAADVYALAGVAYTLISGRSPFHGRSLLQLVLAHAEEIPPRLSERCPELGLPRFLDELLFSCLAKDPAARPHTDEVAGHLARLAREVVTAPAANAATRDRAVASNAATRAHAVAAPVMTESAVAALLDRPPFDDGTGVAPALVNQVFAVIGELAASLSTHDGELAGLLAEVERIMSTITEVEMETALLASSLAEAAPSARDAIAAAKRTAEAEARALHAQLIPLQKRMIVRVEQTRTAADAAARALFAELDHALAELERLQRSAP